MRQETKFALPPLAGLSALMILLFTTPFAVAQADSPPPVPAEEQPEALTSGPVHEAFAQPVELESEAAVVAPKAPPANIEEEPPAERPQGDNYVWVPGYWSWDQDRNDYIWVSACWRVAPDNMSWVPGYWNQTDAGYEWVAGFWTAAGQKEMEYLPQPPAVENVAAPGEPPSADQVWVPPVNYWADGRFVLRRGYWLTAQPGWLWTPSHYVWTPRGYVFCAGHWDYPLERRGVLFAPVYFPRPIYTRVGYRYSPSIVIGVGDLSLNLFTYPRYRHYYFGDYYDASYVKVGIYPRYEVTTRHTWYDPIYVYDGWSHRRTDPHWDEHERHEFEVRRDDRNLRPSRTYREQETRLAKLPEAQRRNVRVAESYKTVVTSKTTNVKFEQINTDTRRKIETQAVDARKYGDQRRTWEASPRAKEPVRTERNTPAPKETKPEERRTPPAERTPAPRVEERKPTGTEERRTTSERKTDITPARDVHRTDSEKVKVPPSSISGRGRDAGGGKTPDAPSSERDRRDAPRDSGKGK